jgi:hypothetical protein
LMNLLHFTVDIISAILKFASQSYLFCWILQTKWR